MKRPVPETELLCVKRHMLQSRHAIRLNCTADKPCCGHFVNCFLLANAELQSYKFISLGRSLVQGHKPEEGFVHRRVDACASARPRFFLNSEVRARLIKVLDRKSVV